MVITPLRWLAVGGLTAAGGLLATSWWLERQARARSFTAVAEVPPRPVAIVLGAQVFPNGRPSTALEDRLFVAAELYRLGSVQTILVSGSRQAREFDEPKAMKRWLCDQGVPEQHITVDPAGVRTLDSMQRAAKVYAVTEAVICTQGFHLPRALFLASRAGIDAVGVCADRRSYANRRRNERRELLAQALAFVDSYVLRTGARSLDAAAADS